MLITFPLWQREQLLACSVQYVIIVTSSNSCLARSARNHQRKIFVFLSTVMQLDSDLLFDVAAARVFAAFLGVRQRRAFTCKL